MVQGNFDAPQGNVADALGPVGDLLSRMVAQLAGHEAGIAALTRVSDNLNERLVRLESMVSHGGGVCDGPSPDKGYAERQAGVMPEDMKRGLEALMAPDLVLKLRKSWGARRRGLDQTDAGSLTSEVLTRWTTGHTTRVSAKVLLGRFRVLGYLLPAVPATSQRQRVIVAPAYRAV